jgi:hypothetical protein
MFDRRNERVARNNQVAKGEGAKPATKPFQLGEKYLTDPEFLAAHAGRKA